jgi:hypothetical protein
MSCSQPFTRYKSTDVFLVENAPLVCGRAIGKTERTCSAKPTIHIHEDNQWTCGKHLSRALEIECAVCMCAISSKQKDDLPCGHSFHRKCLARWEKTSKKMNCPLCRSEYDYVTDDDDDETYDPVTIDFDDSGESDDNVEDFRNFSGTELRRQYEEVAFYQQVWIFQNRSREFIDLTLEDP